MTARSATASGKIIVSGDHALVYGKPGIAFPAQNTITVNWKQDRKRAIEILWPGTEPSSPWIAYMRKIIHRCDTGKSPLAGTMEVLNYLPIGKGMGSSTALLIAMCKTLLGEDCRNEALNIEDEMNPGHSGMDFAVIWENRPIRFQKGTGALPVEIPVDSLANAVLIDTGKPNETTPELVAWVQSRAGDVLIVDAIETIGRCTERILAGEDLQTVMRDHHRAQVALGVVPKHVQNFIAAIERLGGSAKVIGAGARTGGGGMVLAIHEDPRRIHALVEPISHS